MIKKTRCLIILVLVVSTFLTACSSNTPSKTEQATSSDMSSGIIVSSDAFTEYAFNCTIDEFKENYNNRIMRETPYFYVTTPKTDLATIRKFYKIDRFNTRTEKAIDGKDYTLYVYNWHDTSEMANLVASISVATDVNERIIFVIYTTYDGFLSNGNELLEDLERLFFNELPGRIYEALGLGKQKGLDFFMKATEAEKGQYYKSGVAAIATQDGHWISVTIEACSEKFYNSIKR